MEIGRVCKYCHVSTYIAYDNCNPVYKQSFKFEIRPGEHNSLVWDKIIKNGSPKTRINKGTQLGTFINPSRVLFGSMHT